MTTRPQLRRRRSVNRVATGTRVTITSTHLNGVRGVIGEPPTEGLYAVRVTPTEIAYLFRTQFEVLDVR